MSAYVPATPLLLTVALAFSMPLRAADAPHWYAAYGANITEALLNPLDAGGSEEATRQQVARILYDVRMSGGTVVRWITTDVWPQWRCGKDPQDVQTGEIDPAWFSVTRILLEEADVQHVKVVVVLSDFATARADQQQWAAHRAEAAGKDHYAEHQCPAQAEYHGESDLRRMLARPDLRQDLSRRFVTMVTHLDRFSALAAVELFNEPDFRLTHTDVFWSSTHALRAAVRGAISRPPPLYSGVAAWDEGIVAVARRQGDFRDEPVMTVHDYEDYALPGEQDGANSQRLISYLRRIAPGKPLVLSEFGSRVSLRTVDQHRGMVDASYRLYGHNAIGLWVWGTYFPQPEESDYKWDFNHRSPVGAAYRPYAFDPDENRFADGSRLTIHEAGTWVLQLQGERFDGVSRAGVFPKAEIDLGSKRLPTAAVTYFLGDHVPLWIAIHAGSATSAHELMEYQCDPEGSLKTPPALLGLSVDAQYLTWGKQMHCPRSRVLRDFALR